MLGEILMIVATLLIASIAFGVDLSINRHLGATLKSFILTLILYFATATFIWLIWLY